MSLPPPDSRDPSTHLEQAFGELGVHAEDFKTLFAADNHKALVGRMREDDAFAQAVARADAITYLRKWFQPKEGWETNAERSGAVGAGGIAVEWSYGGVHTGHEFNSITPTGRPVVMRGVTMVGLEKGRMKLHRYCDWAGCFAQLGLSLNWRVPVPSAPPAKGTTATAS
jgi:hypothetical protein